MALPSTASVLRPGRRLALLLAGLNLLAPAMLAGARHDHLVAPTLVGELKEDQLPFGHITSLKAVNGQLAVGFVKGVALVDGSGKVLWSLALPEVGVRLVDADATGIAWSGFTFLGVDKGGAAGSFFLGSAADEFTYGPASAGLVGLDGKEVWKADLGVECRVSSPLLTADRVAISIGHNLDLLARDTGKLLASPSDGFPVVKATEGWDSQQPRNRPAFLEGSYFNCYGGWLMVANASGQVQKAVNHWGLLTAHGFTTLSADPVVFKGAVVFGNAPLTHTKLAKVAKGEMNHHPHAYAADAKGEEKWTEHLGTGNSGVGCLATNGDLVFAATNADLSAFNDKGKEVWSQDGPAIHVGSHRGLHYKSLPDGNLYATRFKPGALLLASGQRLYLTSHLEKDHVLTVLDSAKGDYVATWKLDRVVTDLALLNNRLAVADVDGLKLYAAE